MQSALHEEMRQQFSDFFAQPFNDDVLFWTKWTESTFRLDASLKVKPWSSEFNVCYSVVRHALEQGHLPGPFGVLLSSFLLVREAVSLIIGPKASAAMSSFDAAYWSLFNAGLNSTDFDVHLHLPHGELSVSRECVLGVLEEILQALDQEKSQFDVQDIIVSVLVPICDRYVVYREKRDSHRSMARKRLAKSESYRLEMESVHLHNSALIQQYIRHTDVPEFAQRMLLDYWSLKMSVVQNIGESSFHNWQFYWTFVTRLTRYFKASEASSSSKALNEDFDFLHQYFLSEQNRQTMTLENARFLQSFKEFHLLKLETVVCMQKARRLPKLAKNQNTSKLEDTGFDSKTIAENESHCPTAQAPVRAEQPKRGDLLWFYGSGLCLPCEVLLAPDSVCLPSPQYLDRHRSQQAGGFKPSVKSSVETVTKIHRAEVFILSFDDGKGTLSFESDDFYSALADAVLVRRECAAKYHETCFREHQNGTLDSLPVVANI